MTSGGNDSMSKLVLRALQHQFGIKTNRSSFAIRLHETGDVFLKQHRTFVKMAPENFQVLEIPKLPTLSYSASQVRMEGFLPLADLAPCSKGKIRVTSAKTV